MRTLQKLIAMSLLGSAPWVWGQNTIKSIDRLKMEHAQLIVDFADKSQSPEIHNLTDQLLKKNEQVLQISLQRAIDDLRAYASKNEEFLDEEDRRTIDEKIAGYKRDLSGFRAQAADDWNASIQSEKGLAGSSALTIDGIRKEPKSSSPTTSGFDMSQGPIVKTNADQARGKSNSIPGSKETEATAYKINPDLRVILAFDQLGASSAASTTRPSIGISTNVHLGDARLLRQDGPRYFPNYFFTDIRLGSTPTQTLPDFSGVTASTLTSFFGGNNSAKINNLVQSFEVRLGFETFVRPDFGLIVGAGATTTLSPDKTAIAYKIPRLINGSVRPDFQAIFGPQQDFTGIDTLVLTSGDRARFLRNWFVGGRLHKKLVENDMQVYPAVFELTFGQDEVLTSRMRGGVLKFDSFIPIPLAKDKENARLNAFYFQATFSTRLRRRDGTQTLPFFLEPAASVNLYGNSNFVRNFRDIPQLNSDRDVFVFRFGVDLLHLLTGKKDPLTTIPK